MRQKRKTNYCVDFSMSNMLKSKLIENTQFWVGTAATCKDTNEEIF